MQQSVCEFSMTILKNVHWGREKLGDNNDTLNTFELAQKGLLCFFGTTIFTPPFLLKIHLVSPIKS